jgi:hypothetical protein
VTLKSVQQGKATERTVKLAKAEVYRGNLRAARDSLTVNEKVYVQTAGEDARLILDPAAFERRRAEQKGYLRKRWAAEGLPGTVVFSHPDRDEVEVMLDHEALRWGRSLSPGDKVTLQAARPIPAVVRQLRPWRERTQLLLGVDGKDLSGLAVGQRVPLRRTAPAAEEDEAQLPTGPGRGRTRAERIEWLAASVYCPCKMHDECAGHFRTLTGCNSGCGMAKRIRAGLAAMIDKGLTDREIFEALLKEHGPKVLCPHMLP